MNEREYGLWLAEKVYLTDRDKIELALQYETLESFLKAEDDKLRRLLGQKAERLLYETGNLQKEGIGSLQTRYDKMEEKGIRLTTLWDEDYPDRLRKIPDPPFGLFYRGKLPGEEKTVAVIGARECSAYGEAVAKRLGEELGRLKIPLISGMARGIDGIAQWSAIQAGGASYGVLGSGVDVCYPRSNSKLYDKLPERGGVLSLLPPGTNPLPIYFPPRNRIVSGLADLIIVVEAGEKSGTLITVDMALDQGKEVYAVPGRITDRLSIGTNRLIKQGAGSVQDMEDFIREHFEAVYTGRTKHMEAPEGSLESVLDDTPKDMEEIEQLLGPAATGMNLGAALMRLVLEGKAYQPTAGYFCIAR